MELDESVLSSVAEHDDSMGGMHLDAASATPSKPRVSSTGVRHLKPGEENLDPEEQARRIRRRAKDAERKRKDRERMLALKAQEEKGRLSPGSAGPSRSSPSPAAANAVVVPTAVTSKSKNKSGAAVATIASSTSSPSVSSSSKAQSDKKVAERAAAAAEKLAAERASLASTAAEQEEGDEEEGDVKLYCVCKTLYDEERMMIACDRCDEWFHTLCMNMQEEQAELVDMFICPRCEQYTTDRTTWKPACIRPQCTHAAKPPLSRYCSDRCGMLVAASRIYKTKYSKGSAAALDHLMGKQIRLASKTEGMAVWIQEPTSKPQLWMQCLGLEDESQSWRLDTAPSADEEELLLLGQEVAKLTQRRDAVSSSLDLVENRLKLLQLADDRIGVLPPITVDESSGGAGGKKSKSKGSKAKQDEAPGVKSQPRCGYDERLSWDDERFVIWMHSDGGQAMLSGQRELDGRISDELDSGEVDADGNAMQVDTSSPSVCGTARRKCRRHTDWNGLRTEEYEIEKEAETSVLSQLAAQLSRCQSRIEELTALLGAKLHSDTEAKMPVDSNGVIG